MAWENFDLEKETESIKKVLKNEDVGIEEIKEQLIIFRDKYLIKDCEMAKNGIVKYFGGTKDGVCVEAKTVKISEIENNKPATIVAKVYETRELSVFREKKTVVTVYDETGILSVEVKDGDPNLKPGQTYRFINCYIKFSDKYGFAVGHANKDKIEKTNQMETAPIGEILKKLAVGPSTIKTRKINLLVRGTVKKIRPRSDNPKAPKLSGFITIDQEDFRFSTWGDLNLREGDFVFIDKVSAKYSENYGWELTFSDYSSAY